jgi:hypothetical protein
MSLGREVTSAVSVPLPPLHLKFKFNIMWLRRWPIFAAATTDRFAATEKASVQAIPNGWLTAIGVLRLIPSPRCAAPFHAI